MKRIFVVVLVCCFALAAARARAAVLDGDESGVESLGTGTGSEEEQVPSTDEQAESQGPACSAAPIENDSTYLGCTVQFGDEYGLFSSSHLAEMDCLHYCDTDI